MRIKSVFPVLLCIALLCTVVGISALSKEKNTVQTATSDTASADSAGKIQPVFHVSDSGDTEEMRGVWITYMDLDMENTDAGEKAFRKKFETIASTCKESGFNTLIVQVRPFCDALYDSELFPASHILSGRQGEKTEYDPLEIMCGICREKGLKIHAWINPYRVRSKETPKELSGENPYIKDKSLGVETEDGIYLNPALQTVRDLIVKGVCEIAENYDIDGIQFDDYFYPTTDESFDKAQYSSYLDSAGDDPMDLTSWRKANVNIMVAQCMLELHKIKNDIEFGISPQGNIKNNEDLGADVKSWCSEAGYLDYICPQLYYSLDNPALTFEDALNEWLDLEFNGFSKLYIGLAGYKAGSEESDDGTWKDRDDILKQEIEMLRKYNKIDGFMLYAYDSLVSADSKAEIENVIRLLN